MNHIIERLDSNVDSSLTEVLDIRNEGGQLVSRVIRTRVTEDQGQNPHLWDYHSFFEPLFIEFISIRVTNKFHVTLNFLSFTMVQSNRYTSPPDQSLCNIFSSGNLTQDYSQWFLCSSSVIHEPPTPHVRTVLYNKYTLKSILKNLLFCLKVFFLDIMSTTIKTKSSSLWTGGFLLCCLGLLLLFFFGFRND